MTEAVLYMLVPGITAGLLFALHGVILARAVGAEREASRGRELELLRTIRRLENKVCSKDFHAYAAIQQMENQSPEMNGAALPTGTDAFEAEVAAARAGELTATLRDEILRSINPAGE